MDSKSTKRPKTKGASLEASKFDLILKDFRLTSSSTERFLSPENAKSGSYKLKMELINVVTPTGKKPGPFVVTMTVHLEGFKSSDITEEKNTQPEKSFSAKVAAEGLFKLVGPERSCDENELLQMTVKAISEVHILVVDKLRSIVADLGYKNVRPDLGLPLSQLRQIKVDEVNDNQVSTV